MPRGEYPVRCLHCQSMGRYHCPQCWTPKCILKTASVSYSLLLQDSPCYSKDSRHYYISCQQNLSWVISFTHILLEAISEHGMDGRIVGGYIVFLVSSPSLYNIKYPYFWPLTEIKAAGGAFYCLSAPCFGFTTLSLGSPLLSTPFPAVEDRQS